MNRRTFLAASAVSIAGVSGCLGQGGGSGGSYPTPEDGDTDGYPPEFDKKPKKMNVDTSSFKTVAQSGQNVPLVPLSVAYNWYKRGEARFADSRGTKQYETSHVYGAVLSPAPGVEKLSQDPVTDWPKKDRIVCYCGCPHHLSSMRAAKLMNNGYENVFVIDEGYWAWHEEGYPIRGQKTSYNPLAYVIDGLADPAYAGETAWARHLDSGQNEATDILGDGSYSMHVKFHDVTPDTTITVQTPAYEVEGTIEELSSRVITG
ncbi:rhodanese-like domain-containing protein [Haladaptatus sp. NG-WS-4]